jgi:excinuclease UvrABC helicase subunit UvrB
VGQFTDVQELQYLPKGEIEKRIRIKHKHMEAATKELDFIVAAKLRDEIADPRGKFKTILCFPVKRSFETLLN